MKLFISYLLTNNQQQTTGIMTKTILIADSGATKAEWCLLKKRKKKIIFTQGISPYFLNTDQIKYLLEKELKPVLKNTAVDEILLWYWLC
jgi:hypothetical protein